MIEIKMRKKAFFARIAAVLLIALSVSCELSTGSGEDASNPENNGAAEEVSNLFVSTGTGSEIEVVFQCNNTDYWTKYGYTLWGLTGTGSSSGSFVTRTVKVSKVSGNVDAGYGIVLCHGENSDGDITMFTIMINETGYYTIGKVINARYVSIKSWAYSAGLLKDGAINTISVAFDSSSSEFVLTLNGAETCRFSDEDNVVNANGSNGYIVVISPQDTFPADTVEVRFKEE